MGLMARKAAALLALLAGHNATRKTQQIATAALYGTTTLVAGTVTVVATGATALSVVHLTLKTPGGTAGAHYKVVPSADQFIITAVDTSGALVNTDTAAFNYKVETPLYHADVTPKTSTGDAAEPATTALTIASANASSLSTSITLANEMRQAYVQHIADAVGHAAADSTNTLTVAALDPSTALAADVVALANNIKLKFNAHLTQSGKHLLNDTTSTVSTSDATDQSSANTLLNAMKTKINAHLASAPAGDSVTLIGP